MKCPKCGAAELQIEARTVRWVSIDGDGDVMEDPGGDTEWEDNSLAMCNECDWDGLVKDLGE